eukprot:6538760-Alexandrium_andersonii.AAC.1
MSGLTLGAWSAGSASAAAGDAPAPAMEDAKDSDATKGAEDAKDSDAMKGAEDAEDSDAMTSAEDTEDNDAMADEEDTDALWQRVQREMLAGDSRATGLVHAVDGTGAQTDRDKGAALARLLVERAADETYHE